MTIRISWSLVLTGSGLSGSWGACFVFLAIVAAGLGIAWIAVSFQSATRVRAEADELMQTVKLIAMPVVLSVCGFWFLFGIGRGLGRRSPIARWAAVAVLGPACIPPLLFFYRAMRAEVYSGAVCAVAFLFPPAAGALLLTASKTDLLFHPKYPALAGDLRGSSPVAPTRMGLAAKVGLVVIGLAVTIALLVLSSQH